VISVTIPRYRRELQIMTDEVNEDRPNAHDTDPDGANRPAGTVDEDANPPLSDPDEDTAYGVDGTIPASNTGGTTPGPATPPYEGRQTSAKHTGKADDPGIGGASQPEEDPDYRSPRPADTARGATASPADERPASQSSETKGDDDGVEAPAQVTGTRHGEDKP
jgi:hypothetical protein